jgi:large subunit ribosomal protein L5
MNSLQEKYKKEVISKMKEKFGYKSVMAVPKITKAVVNIGFGKQIAGKSSDEQKKTYSYMLEDLATICGQKPILTKSKGSISSFKTRKGMFIGTKVTLRGKKMDDFLTRFINIALPRTRDFQGINIDSIDKTGNLTIGIKEHICFPEISPEQVKSIFGLQIIVNTTAKTKEEGIELLRLMGFPIKK